MFPLQKEDVIIALLKLMRQPDGALSEQTMRTNRQILIPWFLDSSDRKPKGAA